MSELEGGSPLLHVRLLRTRDEKSVLREVALSKKIPFLVYDPRAHGGLLVALAGPHIVGAVGLVMDSHRIPGALGIGFVSAHSDHRRKGVSKALVTALFELARQRNQAIANTAYEPDGERWLKPVMRRTAALYQDVEFYERHERPVYA